MTTSFVRCTLPKKEENGTESPANKDRQEQQTGTPNGGPSYCPIHPPGQFRKLESSLRR